MMGIIKILKHTFSLNHITLDDWNVLTDNKQVEKLINASTKRPQIVYKHSHTCSVCFVAKKELESSFKAIKERADMNFVNVIKARPVSNGLAEQLEVRHESPQVLLIDNEKCIWHASHWSIKADAILDALEEGVKTG